MNERRIAREFFSELVGARERVSMAWERLAKAQDYIGIHPANMSGTGAVHGVSDPTSRLAIRIAECDADLRKAEAAYRLAMTRTRTLLANMPDSREKTVLVSHYVDGMPLYRICGKLDRCEATVYAVHRNALDEAGRIIQKIFQNYTKPY